MLSLSPLVSMSSDLQKGRKAMDIAALSIVMHQARVRQDASVAVLKKVMDSAEENMARMLEISVNPHLGKNLDLKI